MEFSKEVLPKVAQCPMQYLGPTAFIRAIDKCWFVEQKRCKNVLTARGTRHSEVTKRC